MPLLTLDNDSIMHKKQVSYSLGWGIVMGDTNSNLNIKTKTFMVILASLFTYLDLHNYYIKCLCKICIDLLSVA